MGKLLWIKVFLVGVGGTALVTAGSLMLDEYLRPTGDLLFLNMKYAAYVIVLVVSVVCGLIVSAGILITRSFRSSMALSILVALGVSIGSIRGAIDLYALTDNFDTSMFYADLVQIAINLLVYPAICFVIWKLFGTQLALKTDE
jgi:hypothetical protein